jgi:nucleoside-diphosphate-sugar epimerase
LQEEFVTIAKSVAPKKSLKSIMNILVFGGTRFFGKHLVRQLCDEGHNVTIGSRGNSPMSSGLPVEHLTLDRFAESSVRNALGTTRNWDMVFDQICFTAGDAAITTKLLEGRVGRYIHTSTISVYSKQGEVTEADFDPFSYPYDPDLATRPFYGEGKRQAEACYFQRATFPVAAIRIPVVLGPDDYTGRLDFHIRHVLDGKPLVVPNPNAESGYISSTEAADFIRWIGVKTSFTGPVNACTDGRISIGDLLKLIENALGRKATIQSTGNDADASPFTDGESWYANNALAHQLGYKFTKLLDWLPGLIKERTVQIKSGMQ